MSVYKDSDAGWHVPFQVPCAGYFNNISIKLSLQTEAAQWALAFGKVNPNNLVNEMIPATGTFGYLRAKSDHNVARFDWMDIGLMDVDRAITKQTYHAYRNKRLYVKSDEVYTLSFEASTACNAKVIVMADFVPYNNAHFSLTYTLNTLAYDSDFNKALIIPQALKYATLRVVGHVDTATGEHGTLLIRIADRDDPDFDDTSFLAGIGVLDTNTLVTGGDTGASNNMLQIPIGDPNSPQGANNTFDKILPITKIIHEGDAITYDVEQDTGTFAAGDVDMRFILEGKAFQKNKSNFRSHFVEGSNIIRLLGVTSVRG